MFNSEIASNKSLYIEVLTGLNNSNDVYIIKTIVCKNYADLEQTNFFVQIKSVKL